jgi:glycosyltransferase involved in cell wall biosynthesis
VRICLITPGQPSTNPRLVKEADALHDAGHEVHVLCSHYASWADEADKALLASRPWSCTYIGGAPRRASPTYYWTRARHALARRAFSVWPASSFLQRRVLDRIAPELERAALRTPADLYIAHYTGALPAAALAARRYGARLGFDAEDLEFGGCHPEQCPSHQDLVLERSQSRYLPKCDYVTASSSGIAEAYALSYRLLLPTTILNVFPVAHRPPKFRPTNADGPLALYWFSQTVGLDRGLPDAVRALGLLRGRRIELHIRGHLREAARQELMVLAASCGVQSQQFVFHPPGPPDEMVRLSAEYDVGLALEPGVTRNNDMAISNKLGTYLLAGNAVAATATSGQRSVVAKIGGAGYCYPWGDAQVLARGLLAWYENRKELDRARRQAWDWGTREFNWDLEKQRLLGVVEGVFAGFGDGVDGLETADHCDGSMAAHPALSATGSPK